MTVSRRLLDKLAAARDALSHSHPGASEETILEVGLDLILERQAKRRGLVKNPRKKVPTPTPTPTATATATAPRARSRYIPAHIRRAVWERDHGQCQWPIEGGGVCGTTYQVELDHIDGFALGGETSVERCRLLCRRHQDDAARELFGDDLMNNFTRPKGGTCSEPIAAYALG
jgi:5-methylcytosine-specific restriction endonuclease McrA